MKKIIIIILLGVCMLSLYYMNVQVIATDEKQYTDESAFKITESSTGNYIYKYDVSIGGTDVVIPETINGKSVDRIGSQSVFSNKGITSVVLPDTLKEIGDNAFSNNNISRIVIPSSVTKIGKNAFAHNQIQELILPHSVTEIGIACFSSNQINQLTLSNQLSTIPATAFSANKIISVNIPQGIESIDTNAFSENITLKTLHISDTVKTIGDEAFRQCAISDLSLGNQIETIGERAFHYGLNGVTLQFPETLQTIGTYAFDNCGISGTLKIPDSLTSIGDVAFSNNKIENIQFGSGLTTIGNQVFYDNCLTMIDVPSNITNISQNAFGSQNVYVTMNKNNNVFNFAFNDLLTSEQIGHIQNIQMSANYDSYNGVFDSANKIITYDQLPNRSGMPFAGYDYAIDTRGKLEVRLFTNTTTYQVTFKDANGNIISSHSYAVHEIPTPPEDNQLNIPVDKQFLKWDNEIKAVTDEIVYQAVLETKKLEVTFKDDQGRKLKRESVEYGHNATAPNNQNRDGYTFIGWDKEFENVTHDLEVITIYKKFPTLITTDFEIEIGDKFQPLDYVQAIDADGNPIDVIDILENNVNNQVVGQYLIKVVAIDQWGGESTGIINVKVHDKVIRPNHDNSSSNQDEVQKPNEHQPNIEVPKEDLGSKSNDQIKNSLENTNTGDYTHYSVYIVLIIMSMSSVFIIYQKKSK